MTPWPDWSGQTAVIVATGPSAAWVDLSVAQGRARFIAIKSSWLLCPWTDAVYGCDRGWWIRNKGMPQCAAFKITASPSVCKVYPDVHQVKLKPCADVLLAQPGVIGCGQRHGGGHSGFQAMNLAVQWGVTRIVLVGFDMRLDRGARWHADPLDAVRVDTKRTACHRAEMDGAAEQFAALGVEVVNASMDSALRNYRKASLSEALQQWPSPPRSSRSTATSI